MNLLFNCSLFIYYDFDKFEIYKHFFIKFNLFIFVNIFILNNKFYNKKVEKYNKIIKNKDQLSQKKFKKIKNNHKINPF